MLPRNFTALFVVFIFTFSLLLSLPATAFSSSGTMRYDKFYDLDGKILLMIQAGDKDSSPAQHKTLVEGSGEFKRDESIILDSNELSVEADSDWEVDDRQLRGLSIGSAIKLDRDLGDLPEEVAEQVFAVHVESDPGEEGHLVQDWSAAEEVYNEDQELDGMFVIDQDAYTSGGEMKRYIDLVDPASQVYLFEESEIEGSARIVDSLQPKENGENDGGEDDQGSVEEIEEGAASEDDRFTTMVKEPGEEKRDEDEKDEEVFILESEQFETRVPLGTPLEEIELDQTVSLSAEIIEITGIEVKWDSDTIPAYDPDQEGSYIFTGKLHFPEHIMAPENMVLLYTVHVVEDLEAEDEDSETDTGDEDADDEDSGGEDE